MMLFLMALTAPAIAGAQATAQTATPDSLSATRSATLQEPGGTSQHNYDAGTLRSKPPVDASTRTVRHHSPLFWLFDVTINLQHDYDSDGYYSDFSISFDFDTHLTSSLVYAVLYVSSPGQPWIEYAVTGDFFISGSGASDTYTIHATLDSGYQTGLYDHYIEIYDASTHAYLAGFGPHDSHVLHSLPFESTPYDYNRGIASVSLSFTGTGAVDAGTVGALALCLYVIVRRRRQPQIH